MISRITSLLLIVAVIACPMACGQGGCLAAHCDHHQSASQSASRAGALTDQARSADGTVSRARPAQGNSCGCCCETNPPSNSDRPAGCPEKSSCQGICGGAVIDRAGELPGPEASSYPLPLDTAGIIVAFRSTWMGRVQPDGQAATDHGSENPGRHVRILHSSFLC